MISKKKTMYVTMAAILLLYTAALVTLIASGGQNWKYLIWHTDTAGVLPDFSQTIAESKGFSPYLKTTIACYPPLIYLCLGLIAECIPGELSIQTSTMPIQFLVSICFFLVTVALIVLMIERWLHCSNVFKTMIFPAFLFSAPFLYGLERGQQPVFLTVILCAAFLFFYDSDITYQRELALISLALASSMKIVPALLGLLLIVNRQYRDALRCMAYGFLLFFGPFFFLKSDYTVSFLCMTGGIRAYSSLIRSSWGYSFRVSIKAWVTALCEYFSVPDHASQLTVLLTFILAVAMLLCVVLLREKWKRALALTILIILLPPFSWIYNITYLFPIVLLFVNAMAEKDYLSWQDTAYIVFFLLAFAPLPYGELFTSLYGVQKISLNTLTSSLSVFCMAFLLFWESVGLLKNRTAEDA